MSGANKYKFVAGLAVKCGSGGSQASLAGADYVTTGGGAACDVPLNRGERRGASLKAPMRLNSTVELSWSQSHSVARSKTAVCLSDF